LASNKNFYQLLEINENANIQDIKRAMINFVDNYRQNKKKTSQLQQHALQVKRAYEVLSNPDLRKEYDAKLHNQEKDNDENIQNDFDQNLQMQTVNKQENQTDSYSYVEQEKPNLNRNVVLNIEVTGKLSEQLIIAIGAVELINNELTGKTFKAFINPQKKLDRPSMKSSGLTNEFLKDKPSFTDISNEFFAFIKDTKLIAENITKVVQLLTDEFINANKADYADQLKKFYKEDILDIAKDEKPKDKANLQALGKKFNIKFTNQYEINKTLDKAQFLAKIYLALIGNPFVPPKLSELDEEVIATYQDAGVWTRYTARCLDISIYSVLTLILIALITPEFYVMLENILTDRFVAIVYGLFGTSIEIIIYAIFKTTLFKAILDVRVVNRNDEPLSGKDYALRSLRAYVEGLGCNFLITSLVANIMQYKKVRAEGYTSYDKKDQNKVLSCNSKARFIVALLVGAILFFILLVIFNLIVVE